MSSLYCCSSLYNFILKVSLQKFINNFLKFLFCWLISTSSFTYVTNSIFAVNNFFIFLFSWLVWTSNVRLWFLPPAGINHYAVEFVNCFLWLILFFARSVKIIFGKRWRKRIWTPQCRFLSWPTPLIGACPSSAFDGFPNWLTSMADGPAMLLSSSDALIIRP